MDRELIFVLVVFWVTMTLYVMHWHHKRGDLSIETILLSIILGPILAIIIRDEEKEIKKQRGIVEDNNRRMDDSHRRWFQLHNVINRESRPNWYRTIPPPPPISQNRRQKSISNLKDFKFLRNESKSIS